MVAHVVMGLMALAWGLAGLMVALVPTMGLAWVKRGFSDPWWRFWVAQATLLMGLLLIIGTMDLKGFWLWVVCGGLAVAKASLLLGATPLCRNRILERIGNWPLWLYRCGGTVNLAFAVGLAADLILYG